MKFKHIRNGFLLAMILLFLLTLISLFCPGCGIIYYGCYFVDSAASMRSVKFYGTVLDLDEKPVADADVIYKMSAFLEWKGKAVTDKDGHFKINAGIGRFLYIQDIVLQGYEFSLATNNQTSFDYRSWYRDRHRPDKTKPVVFHLRKKHNEAVFLLKKETEIVFKDDQAEKWLEKDMEHGWTRTSEDKSRIEYKEKDDFWYYEATGENHPEKQEWTVRIKVNGENAGIQAGDAMLYEAPEDGYEKEIALTFKYSGEGYSFSPGTGYSNKELVELCETYPKFLYLRLRNPGMYARFCLNYAYVSEKKIYLRFDIVINPYGSRSLEPLLTIYDKKHNADVTNKEHERFRELFDCQDEAEKAMKQQRLAPRPPFEQWIKEGKAIY